MNVDGNELKRRVRLSGCSREQIVSYVQEKGLPFSLAGLNKMFKGEMPKNDLKEILQALAQKLECDLSLLLKEDAA